MQTQFIESKLTEIESDTVNYLDMKCFTQLISDFENIIKINTLSNQPSRSAPLIMMDRIVDKIINAKNMKDLQEPMRDAARFIFSLIHHNEAKHLAQLCEKNQLLLEYMKKMQPKHFMAHRSQLDNVLEHAVSKDAVDVIEFLIHNSWKPSYPLFEIAIRNHARKAFDLLLRLYPLQLNDKNKLVNLAVQFGDVTLLNKLVDGLYYFHWLETAFKENPSGISFRHVFNAVSLAYRFSAMEDVDCLCDKFIIKYKQQTTMSSAQSTAIYTIKLAFYLARIVFPEWGSQVALYVEEEHLRSLNRLYNRSDEIENEINFGMRQFKTVNLLLEKIATNKDFSWDDAVKLIIENRFEEAKRNFNIPAEDFGYLRDSEKIKKTSCMTTAVWGRYDHAYPIINEELKSTICTCKAVGYVIEYQDQVMTQVYVAKHEKVDGYDIFKWNHGIAAAHPQAKIEANKVFKKILTMDTKEVQKNQKILYDEIVKLIWLTGNITPVPRGSGRIVENLLAVGQKVHNIPPAVLDKFQLDCLDITFCSLERYQQLFLYFFKFPTLSTSIQDFLKTQFDTVPEMRKLVTRYNLKPPMRVAQPPIFFDDTDLQSIDDSTWGRIVKSELNVSSKEKHETFKEAFFRLNAVCKIIPSKLPEKKSSTSFLNKSSPNITSTLFNLPCKRKFEEKQSFNNVIDTIYSEKQFNFLKMVLSKNKNFSAEYLAEKKDCILHDKNFYDPRTCYTDRLEEIIQLIPAEIDFIRMTLTTLLKKAKSSTAYNLQNVLSNLIIERPIYLYALTTAYLLGYEKMILRVKSFDLITVLGFTHAASEIIDLMSQKIFNQNTKVMKPANLK